MENRKFVVELHSDGSMTWKKYEDNVRAHRYERMFFDCVESQIISILADNGICVYPNDIESLEFGEGCYFIAIVNGVSYIGHISGYTGIVESLVDGNEYRLMRGGVRRLTKNELANILFNCADLWTGCNTDNCNKCPYHSYGVNCCCYLMNDAARMLSHGEIGFPLRNKTLVTKEDFE